MEASWMRMRRGHPVRAAEFRATHPNAEIWLNPLYVAIVSPPGDLAPEEWTWLSLRRQDREPDIPWRHMQWIKNDICGPEREAIEVFPAESRLVDGANQRHLWVLPEGVTVGVGFTARSVLSEADSEIVGRLTGLEGRQS